MFASKIDKIIDTSRRITRDLDFLRKAKAIPEAQYQESLVYLVNLFADIELERTSKGQALKDVEEMAWAVDETLRQALTEMHDQQCWTGHHPEAKYVQ